jgi:1-acyl-sn-glycerol-3-phosphate acyltransferase
MHLGEPRFLSAAGDLARTARTFGYFFGRLPFVARRAAGQSQADARALARAHAARARRIAGIELAVEGAEKIPRGAPFVLIYNESSLAQDVANLEVLVRLGIDKAVFASDYGAIPWVARAAPAWGIVLLRRGHREDVDQTLDELVAALRAGERVSMAPQGRISPDGSVCHFKRGAFLVAIRARVPVVPMGVRGGPDILPPRSLRMHRGVLRYRIGEPIPTAGRSEADAPALAERAHEVVVRLVEGADGQ